MEKDSLLILLQGSKQGNWWYLSEWG